EGGEVLNLETAFRRKDGSTIFGSISARRIEFDGTPAVLSVMRDITGRKRAEEELKRAHDELEEAYDATIEGWALAMELRDSEIEGHSRRVTNLTIKLAEMFGLPGEEITNIRRGVLLHDIGKMAITDSILQKKGPLTEEEWAIMRKHPTHAYRMLSSIAYLQPSLDIPYCHHEHWDGSGYPRGLKGEEIPLAARLFAVVDVWDALRSDRPYRAAMTRKEALEYIRSQSSLYFDPQVVDLFMRLVDKDELY
ncbi:MAG: HD domain-containing phosphohydrolase, partial [Chloroflexota bacterium]